LLAEFSQVSPSHPVTNERGDHVSPII